MVTKSIMFARIENLMTHIHQDSFFFICDTISSIRSRLCWRHSEDLFVLARNPHKGLERETGSGGGKEGPRKD